MKPAKGAAAVAAATLGGILTGFLGTGVVFAAAGKADFSLSASPATVSIQQGQSAGSAITLSTSNGFASNVGLTAAVTSAPSSATSSTTIVPTLSTATLTKAGQTSSLTVASSPATVAGQYLVTVTGSGGGLTHTAVVTVNVSEPPPADYTLGVSPSAQTMLPGSTASYSISIARSNNFAGAVALGVSGLPTGATATFTPASTTGTSSTLQVSTKNNSPAGTYVLAITGTATNEPAQSASATLVLTTSGRAFTIAGTTASPLIIGVAQSLTLTVTNPNNQPLSVTNITVSVQSVTQAAGATGTCGSSDYSITQIPGTSYPINVPANGSVNLATAGVALPQIQLLDDATRLQDGCKGATVNLLYNGTGQG